MSKILVVDDNNDILMLLRVTFESAGHEVTTTSDPFNAIPLAEEKAPDAVVLDVMMPGLSGWDILQKMRLHPEMRTLPVVLLTALTDVNDRVRGLRGGADDYQVKPFEPDEMLARIEGLVARREALLAVEGGNGAGSPENASLGPAPLEQVMAELECRISACEDLTGLCLGRYEIQDVLGRGAMGTVLRGWDPKLRRSVALKTIRFTPETIDDAAHEHRVSRLLEEAVVNARVSHPNIVTVYDVGEEGQAAFIAMELIEGSSLESRLDEYEQLPHPFVIPLAAAVARALAAAHAQGIVHRDIKPANVLLSDGEEVKVTDFGIAEFLSRASAGGAVFGTPGYLAPETLTGAVVSPASDLFSLGVTIYECLTGRNPFRDRSWRRTLANTIAKDPRPLAEQVPDLPPAAEEMVSRMLSKEPGDRPQEAIDVAEVFEQLTMPQRQPRLPRKSPRPGRPHRIGSSRSRLVTLDTVIRPLSVVTSPA